jgi:hypothetical protein
MPCPVDTVLLRELAEATEGYFGTVNTLCNVVGRTESNGPSFSEAYKRAKQEHENCERNRDWSGRKD